MAMQVEPSAPPAPISGDLVRARRHCAGIFENLWRDAWSMPCYAEAGIRPSGMRRTTIMAAAKHRARLFVAAKLGIAPDVCRPDQMSDVEQLRTYYRICRDHAPADVRAWWIETHPTTTLGELKIGDKVRMKLAAWPSVASCEVTGFGELPPRLDSDELAPTIKFQKLTATGRLSKTVIELFLGGPAPERLERDLLPVHGGEPK